MKTIAAPLSLLLALLALGLWNGAVMTAETERLREQLQQADGLVRAEDWAGAQEMLEASYQDWSARQTYLHIVSPHAAVDEAEAMYHRSLSFAGDREGSECRAEIAGLREQLRLLAEMERFHIKNIL